MKLQKLGRAVNTSPTVRSRSTHIQRSIVPLKPSLLISNLHLEKAPSPPRIQLQALNLPPPRCAEFFSMTTSVPRCKVSTLHISYCMFTSQHIPQMTDWTLAEVARTENFFTRKINVCTYSKYWGISCDTWGGAESNTCTVIMERFTVLFNLVNL